MILGSGDDGGASCFAWTGPAMKDDEARRQILNRRARFVTAALASAGLAASAQSCGGQTERDGSKGDAGADVSPQPCLIVAQDAEPQPCLKVQWDAEPRPCLEAPPPEDAAPQPCLTPY